MNDWADKRRRTDRKCFSRPILMVFIKGFFLLSCLSLHWLFFFLKILVSCSIVLEFVFFCNCSVLIKFRKLLHNFSKPKGLLAGRSDWQHLLQCLPCMCVCWRPGGQKGWNKLFCACVWMFQKKPIFISNQPRPVQRLRKTPSSLAFTHPHTHRHREELTHRGCVLT